MATKPSKQDRENDDAQSNINPAEYLRAHGADVAKVWRTWSAGESDFGPYETILFTTSSGLPRTAVLLETSLVMRDGWNLFYVECYRHG